jgi:hypothetical protein
MKVPFVQLSEPASQGPVVIIHAGKLLRKIHDSRLLVTVGKRLH